MPFQSTLTPDELSVLQETRIFRLRASTIPKIMALFKRLKDALQEELPSAGFLAPEGLDLLKGQVAKGDNHEGMPFVFMDYPRYFHREEMFTYRAFFWWGHHVTFAMILKGPHLETYKQRLLSRFQTFADKGVHLAAAADPWDWHQGPPHTLELTSGRQDLFPPALQRLDYLKIERFIPLSPVETLEKRILETGIDTFRDLFPLIGKETSMQRSVLLFCPNLFWGSRVLEAGKQTGVPVKRFDRIEEVAQSLDPSSPVSLVILDIDPLKNNGMETITEIRRRLPEKALLWGVGSHVDTVSREKAEALGCHKVWVRSEFTRRVAELLKGTETP